VLLKDFSFFYFPTTARLVMFKPDPRMASLYLRNFGRQELVCGIVWFRWCVLASATEWAALLEPS